eukprot:2656952-Prorocentrum_lima.AAC.1
MSEEAYALVQQRNSLMSSHAPLEEIALLNKRFRQVHRRDKRDQQTRQVTKDMHTRDRWLGIRQLRRTRQGTHIGPSAVVNQA